MNFSTILEPANGEFKDRGSKFLSFIHVVSNLDEFKSHLSNYKKNHPQAVHVVSAFRLCVDGRIDEFSSDDGEPRGSSGPPVLNMVKKN